VGDNDLNKQLNRAMNLTGSYDKPTMDRKDIRTLKETLRDAFVEGKGHGVLIEALLRGLERDPPDPTCMKLAFSYRYGLPQQQVIVSASALSDDELLARSQQLLAQVAKNSSVFDVIKADLPPEKPHVKQLKPPKAKSKPKKGQE